MSRGQILDAGSSFLDRRRIAPMTDDRGLEVFVPDRAGGFVRGGSLAPPMCMDVFIVLAIG